MVAGLAMLGMSASASAALVSFSPSSGTFGVGGSTSVDVVISGLGDLVAPSVGTYDFNVAFNSSVLGLTGVTFGTGLDLSGLGGVRSTDASVAGTVNVFELSLDSEADLNDLQSGSFTLFTLFFEGLAPGTSALSLAVNALGDALGETLEADVSGGELTVTADTVVPLPAAVWLLLSGLGGLGILGRRRRT
jgi:hypothetical protein